jgi:hypothetical protein
MQQQQQQQQQQQPPPVYTISPQVPQTAWAGLSHSINFNANDPRSFGPPPAYSAVAHSQQVWAQPVNASAPMMASPYYPGPPPLPYQQQQTAVVLINNVGSRIPLNRGDTFFSHIILSCFVFWCCNWVFGLIAFILAGKLKQFVIATHVILCLLQISPKCC